MSSQSVAVPPSRDLLDVLIVEDHTLLSETLAGILTPSAGFETELVSDLTGALARIARHGRFSVVLLDYQLPGVEGLDGLARMTEANQGGVVLFSGVAGWGIVDIAITMGAMGFIPKTTPVTTLLHAIRLIAEGERYLPLEYMQRQTRPEGLNWGLTPREGRVLALLREGLANKQIAQQAGISEVIVKLDVRSICRKLGVSNRTSAVLAAQKNGL